MKKGAKSRGLAVVAAATESVVSDAQPVDQLPSEPAVGANSSVQELALDGLTYRLDFSIPALCAAEEAFNAEGRSVNLLFSLSVATLNLRRLRDLFAAAVRTHHPELGYQGAVALVTTAHLIDIANATFTALQGTVPRLVSR